MFHGSMVALVTPMDDDGNIDYDALSTLLEWHIEKGTDGIVAMGTTGESATVLGDEHLQVIKHTVKVINGRIPVIAGSGSSSTEVAVKLTKEASNLGVDACLLMSPAYVKPTQEGIYQHYKLIAESVSIPQIVYNVPGRTACDILPETVARLAEFPNIIGIKEATGDISRVSQLKKLCDTKIDLYSGEDPTAKDFILAGGNGVISVTANIAPKAMHDMAKAAMHGNQALANDIDKSLQPLHQALFLEANPIPVKWAAHYMGLIPAGIRLPLTPLSKKYHQQVIDALHAAKAAV